MRGLPHRAFFLAACCLRVLNADEGPDFNREIRPILAENCFHCHGPDKETREGSLRLDTFEGATEGGEFGVPVVPGRPDESELMKRIHSDDPDDLMPPPESKRLLSEGEKELLGRWISSGAKYEEHWAWVAPVRGALPQVEGEREEPRPVDAFLLRRLQDEGLGFSGPARPGKLLRRLSLDLTGLPPTPSELKHFLEVLGKEDGASGAGKAYEAEVDRLLNSPRFGERWARHWLDLARYADSNGFQADQLRPSWAYRDWVIDALNANMPYDRFTIEQLAGDLLPGSTLRQKVATGFHRTVTCNVEAGVSPEGNRVNQVFDRVNTTATVWLGVTLECAQCHDHKYDPFTMKDYYSMFAFFNNTPLEVQLPSNKNDVSHDFVGPYLDLPFSPEQMEEARTLDRIISALDQKRADLAEKLEGDFPAWLKGLERSMANRSKWQVMLLSSFESTGGESHEVLEDGSILLKGKVPDTATYTLEVKSQLSEVAGFKLEALSHADLPGKGPGRGDSKRPNFILNELEVFQLKGGEEVPLVLKKAESGFSQKNWEVDGAIDGKPKTGWAINPRFGQSHEAHFWLEKGVRVDPSGSFLFRLKQNYGNGRVIGNVRLSAISGPSVLSDLPEEVLAILEKPAEKRKAVELKKLQEHFLGLNANMGILKREMAKVKKKRAELKPDRTLVMVEMETPRKTRILRRGQFLSPGEEVGPGVPGHLPGLDKASNRLDLARWLVRRDNPLTARVAVNRWWAELFGKGIVTTSEDFGTQSEPPTHPNLLDWLAVELMESGWNMKHMIKTMVMSRAYRQSSRITPELLEKDPRNLLYARAPRFRMDAERIRDNALGISGLLSTRMHGRPVMPHQPGGLWRQTGRNEPKWVEQKDENRWRRGIYIVYRRAAPYPSMVNFDAPDRSSCTVRRPRTNTPSQALTLLNDPAFVEMALAFADRILVESTSPNDRYQVAFEMALSRPPNEKERAIVAALVEDRLTHYREHPDTVREIMEDPGLVYRPKYGNLVELATWFQVANALLNLDEVMTRD